MRLENFTEKAREGQRRPEKARERPGEARRTQEAMEGYPDKENAGGQGRAEELSVADLGYLHPIITAWLTVASFPGCMGTRLGLLVLHLSPSISQLLPTEVTPGNNYQEVNSVAMLTLVSMQEVLKNTAIECWL